MDPLSEVLSLLKPQSCISGGFPILGDIAIRFGKHLGIKCYAMISGECWLSVEGVAEPVHLKAGDCYILPRGLPFTLTTDLSLPPIDFSVLRDTHKLSNAAPIDHPTPAISSAVTSSSPAFTQTCSSNRFRRSYTSVKSLTAPLCAGPSIA